MTRVLIVSNRLPVTLRSEHGKARFVPSSGGLATALRRSHANGQTLWIGWPGGDVSRLPPADVAALNAELALSHLVPVHLTTSEVAHYYDGFSNAVLWPLLHFQLEKVRLDAQRDWTVYRSVNQRFAEAVAANYRPGDLVWVHDYQLALVPAMVRALVPGAAIGFFLHVPFPPSELFRILPWRREIVAGILGANVVGLHTPGYCANFRDVASAVGIATEAMSDGVRFEGRRVRVSAHPIGIDVDDFQRVARSEDVAAEVAQLKADARGKLIVLGVDRLDYTKGIPRRLLAFDRFLERNPRWRGKVLFVQLAVPSREKVDAYADLRRQVNELVGRINAHHGTPTGAPVQLLYRSLPIAALVGLYRTADVMLVTPLRDGMNLVAKEYVASRIDDQGVLVLSEFAGAAVEMQEAIVVNPYDLDALAASIRQALEMPVSEQSARMRALRQRVAARDTNGWAQRFIAELERATGPERSKAVRQLGDAPAA